ENPEGTVLCESCGKPIEGNQSKDGNENEKLLNMRYEGSARRSKTYNTRIVDRIWTFFSSVKVGVWLIALTLIASILGTDRKSTRLNSSHVSISYAVFCLKEKIIQIINP